MPRLLAHLRVRDETQAVQAAGQKPLDQHLATRCYLGQEVPGAMADEDAGPMVDELLGQPVVESVRQTVLDGSGPLLPVSRVGQPAGPVGDVGPGADLRQPGGKLIDFLESNGLVSREREVEDRRVQRVSITAEGMEIVRELDTYIVGQDAAKKAVAKKTPAKKSAVKTTAPASATTPVRCASSAFRRYPSRP